jgi:hypothetical protein
VCRYFCPQGVEVDVTKVLSTDHDRVD